MDGDERPAMTEATSAYLHEEQIARGRLGALGYAMREALAVGQIHLQQGALLARR
jgi:hypothetical protein